MKKILSFVCVFSILLIMTACGGQNTKSDNSSSGSKSSSIPESQQSDRAQQSNGEEASAPDESSEKTQSTGTEQEGSDILIVYFSATGTTKTLAGYVA